MAEPFIGEIRLFGFGLTPHGWAPCNGQTMNIAQNMALYSLLGTTFGGDGVTTFKLPDLRGRTMIHPTTNYPQGTAGGSETVALSQIPLHTHTLAANPVTGASNDPASKVIANVDGAGKTAFSSTKPSTTLASAALSTTGGSAAHSNMQPSLVINCCIALMGIYPSRD